MTATIPLLNFSSPAIRAQALRAVRDVFRADVAGDCTLEIVRIIARVLKQRRMPLRRPHLHILQSFLLFNFVCAVLCVDRGQRA